MFFNLFIKLECKGTRLRRIGPLCSQAILKTLLQKNTYTNVYIFYIIALKILTLKITQNHTREGLK